jgi:hypothetical protein
MRNNSRMLFWKRSVWSSLVALIVAVFPSCSFSSALLFFSQSGGRGQLEEARKGPTAQTSQVCSDAAKRLLGPKVEILKCGFLNDTTILETVAIVGIGCTPLHHEGTLVSRLAVLRKESSGWKAVLDVGKEITNGEGYVGIDYIDDSFQFHGYRIVLADHRSDGKPSFTIRLSYITQDGESDGIPLEIAWNEKVGRYQEFTANEVPEGFRSEIKNPTHVRTRKQNKK